MAVISVLCLVILQDFSFTPCWILKESAKNEQRNVNRSNVTSSNVANCHGCLNVVALHIYGIVSGSSSKLE